MLVLTFTLFACLVAILSRNPQYNFPKMRGGGSKAVWNFSEVSSVLVCAPVPKNTIHLLCGIEDVSYDQDMKSNKGIFDRNSEYMTRKR